jgi:signal transduction histidine kinase
MDRTRAQQLFQNLLSNAIRCNDKPQGRIVVSCNEAGGERRYSVADNGPGIEPRHYERVFQMFQTLDARDEDRGTGVGLALVRKIVELHGGRIWIESEPGRGCTFHFTLPKASPCIPAATRSS